MINFFSALLLLTALTGKIFGQSDSSNFHYPDYWSKERIYKYSGLYSDSSGEIITSEKITLQPTGKTWDADPKQTLMDFKLDSITADWNKLPPVPLNGKLQSWMINYQEGVLQTSNKVWMHPIRKNQYILTELAPFPEIVLPIKKDTTWKNTLWIYEAFGTFEGTVECTYTITGVEIRTYEFGILPCWKIIATGMHDKLGINSAIYYFNEEVGFTEMNYLFYNKQKIEFKLTSIKK